MPNAKIFFSWQKTFYIIILVYINMKSRLLEFNLDQGQRIWVEVKDQHIDGQAVAEGSGTSYNRSRQLGEAVEVIRPLIDKVMQPLKTLASKPQRVELQFGFSIGSNAEVVLDQNQQNSHIKVNLVFEEPT